jgi:exosortase K
MLNPTKSCAKYVGVHLRANGLFYAVGLTAMLVLKFYYSIAVANDLRWILGPIARLVELLAGIQFQWDSHAGFVSHSREIVIAPACAGINFLIICFSTLYFTFLARLNGDAAKCCWFCICVATAYLVTLCGNTVRILISIYLYGAEIYGGWVTPERIHCLAGTAIYISILLATYLAAERFLGRSRRPEVQVSVTENCGGGYLYYLFPIPFIWYLLVTVFAPLLNGALGKGDSRFVEHAALVLSMCLVISTLPVSIAAILKKRVDMAGKTKEKSDTC